MLENLEILPKIITKHTQSVFRRITLNVYLKNTISDFSTL